MRELAAGETPTIFGEGTQTLDFVYVKDVVAATLAAHDANGGVFNVGTGIETSVNELYEAVRRIAGADRAAEHAPARTGEIERSVLDAGHAERELGWRPEHTLDQGLAETWAWVAAE
jgi:UDP-glucose 4-epimerase